MKTPSFWYRKPDLAAFLLAPIGQFYRAGALIRRLFAHPYKAAVPMICIGNIVAGGAGKTPTAIALAKLLMDVGAQPVFVTRGYGGKEKGPLRVDLSRHTAADVGDEALLLAQVAPVWIARTRVLGVREAEKEASHILLDDGLQNPTLAPDVNILVVDGTVGFGNRMIFPAGPLRETLNDAFSRVSAIVMVGEDKQRVTQCLGKQILQARLNPVLPPVFLNEPNVLAFAGIGRPSKFYDSCREAGLNVVESRDYPDHHRFTLRDLSELSALALRKDLRLITTEKDWVRLPDSFRADVAVLHTDLLFADEDAALRVLQSSTTAPRDPS